jgi:hypothetical protein
MYAVQRLYETSEEWKEKREQFNSMLLAKVAPFQPITYSKKPQNYTSARYLTNKRQ